MKDQNGPPTTTAFTPMNIGQAASHSMSTTSHDNEQPDKGWVSSFLLIFGLFSVLISGFAIAGRSLFAGLLGVALAIIFFALLRIIDQQDSTAHRLRKSESELESRRGGGA